MDYCVLTTYILRFFNLLTVKVLMNINDSLINLNFSNNYSYNTKSH